MMTLTTASLVNWHLFDVQDIHVDGNIGVIGANRSGKSTLLDLIQVVISGAQANALRLNASASEAGQRRGGRSVHAYCLGRLGEDDQTLRAEALTYIALVFTDPDNALRKPVSIGLAMEARRGEARETVLGRFVLDGAAITTADLTQKMDDGSLQPAPWETVRARLTARAEAGGGSFANHRDTAGDYVRDYLRRLSPSGRGIDERRFLRSFVNALAFEHMRTATDFVRRFILEHRPINIRALRESIATYREIRRNIEELTRRLSGLRYVETSLQGHAAAAAALAAQRWIAARARFFAAESAYAKAKAEHARALRRARDAALESDRLTDEIGRSRDALKTIEQSIGTSGVREREALLKERRRRLERELAEHLSRIQAIHRRAVRALDLLRIGGQLGDFPLFVATLEKLSLGSAGLEPPAWPQDAGAIDALLAELSALALPVADFLDGERERLMGERAPLLARQNDMNRELRMLSAGRNPIGRDTEALVEVLREAGMKPRVVCELLDITDESWRDAAEALLGRDREAVLVDPQDVDEALRIRRRERGAFRSVRLVNTRKIDRSEGKAQAGTLASVFSATDPFAMALVVRRLGNVRLAETQDDLHKPGRAIMRDGTYDDGLVIETREVHDRKIGSRAGGLMRSRVEQELAATGRRVAELDNRLRIVRSAEECVAGLRSDGSAEQLSVLTGRHDEAVEALGEVERQMGSLDRLIDPALVEQRNRLSRRLAEMEQEKLDQVRAHAVAETEVRAAEHLLAGPDTQSGSRACRDRLRTAWLRSRGDVPALEGRLAYRKAWTAADLSHDRVLRDATQATGRGEEALRQAELAVRQALSDYFLSTGQANPFSLGANLGTELGPWVAREIAFIEEAELTRWQGQAAAAAEKASVMFRTSFIHELRARFDEIDREIRELNRALHDHPLHHERYSFQKAVAGPFEALAELVRLSEADEDLMLPLFQGAVPADSPAAAALAAVESILLDEDFDFEEYEDVRNYFVFDLTMEDLASGRRTRWDVRRASGSGAEQQVPFYVAIGSALAMIYHGTGRAAVDSGERGLGIAVFDEAFSKMDSRNQREMLRYYSKIGLQTIIAAPFDSRATFYESMDSLVEVYRFGDQAQTDVRLIRERTRTEMQAINPEAVLAGLQQAS